MFLHSVCFFKLEMGISVNVGFADFILWLILYGMGRAVWEGCVFYILK